MKNKPENINHNPIIRTSWFRFYEELNDFLPQNVRKRSFPYNFTGTPSIKNTIEAIGVPHAEVDLILVDGKSVGFDFLIIGGEQVSVYPEFETLDISPIIHLRPKPLRITKFVVDVNLGKLALKLRLLGFDTLFRNDLEDDEIVKLSVNEKRIILTRDLGVLKHNDVTHGYWLRNSDPKKQLHEIVERLQLQNSFNPFTRCSNCNGSLDSVAENEIEMILPEDTRNSFNQFWKCTGCGQIYWKGSHYDKICEWIENLKNGNWTEA
ncbi:MAG: Mut7-C RNAse domain-containing protein [Bacteroidota bacterium]